MSKMIQLRNVPEDVHRSLKRRAVDEGTTLSEYLVREVTEIARRPTIDDVLRRIKKRRRVEVTESSPAAVRSERDARG